MRSRMVLLALITMLSATVGVRAQQPDFPKPQKEHEWLKKFAGEWEMDTDAVMGPGQDPVRCQGTITSQMLGGFWVVNKMQGDMMGTPVTGIQTIGYDAKKKKYVGTWVDSATSHMWHYEGTVEGGNKIVLAAEGPNLMAEGKTAQFRDIYEFTSDDQMVLTSSMLGDDGKWVDFMTGSAKRVK